MKKILIIGGAGFVGSHLVEAHKSIGNEVFIYDNFSTGIRQNVSAISDENIIIGDILERELLFETVRTINPEIIYHLAAIHFIPKCETDPWDAIRVNIEGTQNVLMASTLNKNKLIFSSTGAIYDPEIETALNETSNISPSDIYGITKESCERLIKYHIKKGRGEAIIARLFNVVGTRETNPHLLPIIMDQLVKNIRVIELGNLYPKRDYVHVKDVAEALVSLSNTHINGLEIFNIGTGEEYSVGEIIKICEEVISEPINAISTPERTRKFDRKNQLANINKITEISGWAPKRNLKKAIEEIWQERVERK